MNFKELLIENPVIAAIRNEDELNKALKSKAMIAFVLYGTITNINDICKTLKKSGKIVFIHMDLIEGLKGDLAALQYIKEKVDLCGIITTRGNIVKIAKNLNLLAIQRFFIVDSLSLQTAIKNIKESQPDAVEIMPGISGKIIKNISDNLNFPVIAGGLIESKEDIISSLGSGAVAISTTKSSLWDD